MNLNLNKSNKNAIKNNKEKIEGSDPVINKSRHQLQQAPIIGTVEFILPGGRGKKSRLVKQNIRATRLTLLPSEHKKNLPKIAINAVLLEETETPEGEEPISWMFLTTLPIDTLDEIQFIIKIYLSRWGIELFFKVLKSGCKIEERQLQTTDRMKSLLAVFMVLSWRVMFTMMLGRVCAEMSCADIFDDAEWKSVYKILNKKKPLPKKPPSIKVFIEMVAVLGGYVPQSNGGPPGVKVMWKGMARMVDFAIAWEAFGE